MSDDTDFTPCPECGLHHASKVCPLLNPTWGGGFRDYLAEAIARAERAEATVAALTPRLAAADALAGAVPFAIRQLSWVPMDEASAADYRTLRTALAAWAAANPPTEGGA